MLRFYLMIKLRINQLGGVLKGWYSNVHLFIFYEIFFNFVVSIFD